MIRKAILIILSLFFSLSAHAHDLTWENLMLAAAKLQPNFDHETHVDSYMKLYRAPVWERYRNDEFELQDKRDETIKIMKERVNAFNLSEEFIINTAVEFGDYDFKRGLFPIAGPSATSYYYERKYGAGTFPNTFKAFFSNTNKFGDLVLPKDEAKEFLQSHKDRYGHIDRELPVKIQCLAASLKSNDSLVMTITKITVYGDKNRTQVVAEF